MNGLSLSASINRSRMESWATGIQPLCLMGSMFFALWSLTTQGTILRLARCRFLLSTDTFLGGQPDQEIVAWHLLEERGATSGIVQAAFLRVYRG